MSNTTRHPQTQTRSTHTPDCEGMTPLSFFFFFCLDCLGPSDTTPSQLRTQFRVEVYLADTAEDKGLAGIVTVGTDTEVHLAGVSVLLEGLSDTENGIGRA